MSASVTSCDDMPLPPMSAPAERDYVTLKCQSFFNIGLLVTFLVFVATSISFGGIAIHKRLGFEDDLY